MAVIATRWLGGMRALFPEEPLWLGLALQSVRYGLVGLWIILVWPWLSVKVGLTACESQRESRGDEAAR